MMTKREANSIALPIRCSSLNRGQSCPAWVATHEAAIQAGFDIPDSTSSPAALGTAFHDLMEIEERDGQEDAGQALPDVARSYGVSLSELAELWDRSHSPRAGDPDYCWTEMPLVFESKKPKLTITGSADLVQ